MTRMILGIILVGIVTYYLTQATMDHPLLAWLIFPMAFLPLLVDSE
jgi:hypothetical protein